MTPPRAPRYRIRGLDVIYDTGEEYWTGPVIDVSASGLFIETAHELPIGTALTLMLGGAMGTNEDERVPFEVAGVVIRVHELDIDEHYGRIPGIAVRFTDLSGPQAEALHAFLRDHGTALGSDNPAGTC